MNGIALTVSMLALVAVVGLWIGGIKIRGVGFGIGGVLFGGITIGIQVGPGFFSSLRVSGLRLNLFAILIVVIGALVTALIYKLLTCRCPWCWGYSPARSPTPGAGLRQRPACHKRRCGSLLRHRLPAGDVPAHHHAPAAGGDFLDVKELSDDAALIRPTERHRRAGNAGGSGKTIGECLRAPFFHSHRLRFISLCAPPFG
jgi:hypothetical protein